MYWLVHILGPDMCSPCARDRQARGDGSELSLQRFIVHIKRSCYHPKNKSTSQRTNITTTSHQRHIPTHLLLVARTRMHELMNDSIRCLDTIPKFSSWAWTVLAHSDIKFLAEWVAPTNVTSGHEMSREVSRFAIIVKGTETTMLMKAEQSTWLAFSSGLKSMCLGLCCPKLAAAIIKKKLATVPQCIIVSHTLVSPLKQDRW